MLGVCLLAAADGGDSFGGAAGLRGVYVFLFVRDRLTRALEDALATSCTATSVVHLSLRCGP